MGRHHGWGWEVPSSVGSSPPRAVLGVVTEDHSLDWEWRVGQPVEWEWAAGAEAEGSSADAAAASEGVQLLAWPGPSAQ